MTVTMTMAMACLVPWWLSPKRLNGWMRCMVSHALPLVDQTWHGGDADAQRRGLATGTAAPTAMSMSSTMLTDTSS